MTQEFLSNEMKALVIGNNHELLKARLLEAKDVLKKSHRDKFTKKSKFDFPNKRLVSDDGTLALQWKLRNHPDKPESYHNQQTSCGKVSLVDL